MNIYPRIEARISVQERRQVMLEARIEELSEDMIASFKQLSEHLGKIETSIATKEDLAAMATKEDLVAIKKDLADTKATMATKEDLAAMENRILNTFKQLLTVIDSQRPPSKQG